jgi:lysophospholipase
MINPVIDRRAHPPTASFSAWKAPDGWILRRMDWPQAGGEAVRGSILFASGRGDFIEKYIEACGHWHRRGWNVTSFDWRGQGASRGDIVGGHLDSFDPLIEDMEALTLQWLDETPGPHVVIGHSMGGHLLLRMLVEKLPGVDAAVLVAPMIEINSKPAPAKFSAQIARALSWAGLGKRKAWKDNERPTLPGKSRQRFLTGCTERYEDELWWKEREPGFDLGPPSWGWLDAAFRSIASVTTERLARLETPILLMGTERDRLVSPEAIKRAAAILPKAELCMFADAAHEILRERDPYRTQAFARIDKFLDRHAG